MALKKYPGFIDPHVHLREPGAEYKEDFNTGSRAAVIGGFSFILDMPNNPTPTISVEALEEKIRLAKSKSLIDIGFHYGATGENCDTFKDVWDNKAVYGLKIYCNDTTGDLLVNDLGALEKTFQAWESSKPILVHAEGVQLAAVVALCGVYERKLHVCHVSRAEEVELVRLAKKKGFSITAGVCPHHLFLTDKDVEKMKGYAIMKPPLGTEEDQKALWEGLNDGIIDIVETDHAPHSREEKEQESPVFGITGLESAVGLMFKAVKEGKIQESDIAKLLHDNAKKIFNIPDQADTYVELDPDKPYICGEDGYESKCGWSSFDGWELYGKIETLVYKGETIISKGKLINK